MPTPDFGECGEGAIIDEREPFPPSHLGQRPRVYLGKRVHPRGPRAHLNHFKGPNFRYLWFELNGVISMLLIHLGTLRIVPCHPEEGPLRDMINNKAVEQAVRDVYETKTGQSGMPGTGPADYIRGFAGINVPKKSGTRRMKGGVIPEIGEHVSGVVVDNNKPFKAWSLAQQARGPRTYLGKRVEPRGPLATGNQTNYPAKLLWFEKNGVVTPLWVITWSLKAVDEYQPDKKRPKTARGRTSLRKTLRKRK